MVRPTALRRWVLVITGVGLLAATGCVDEIRPPEAAIEVGESGDSSRQAAQMPPDADTSGDAGSSDAGGTVDAGDSSDSGTDANGSAGGEQTFRVGEDVPLDGSSSEDPQGRPLTYRWNFVSVPTNSDVSFNDPTVQSPSFVPDVPGEYRVQLVVSNGVHASEPATATIQVSECGSHAPVVSDITASPENPGIDRPIELSPDVTDADNASSCGLDQTLQYAWSLKELPAGSEASLNQRSAVSPTLVADEPGTYVAELVVTDSTGRTSDPKRVSVDVAACGNAAPVVDDVTASPSNPNLGQVVGLEVTASDPDTSEECGRQEHFSYDWQFVELPADSQVELNAPGSRTPGFRPDSSGTYVVEVTVTDSTGRTSEPTQVEVPVTTCGGATPVVDQMSATPQNPNTGQTVQLNAQASDADNTGDCGLGQSLRYDWTIVEIPAGSDVELNQVQAANPSFEPDVPGDYTFRVDVTDSTGRTSDASTLTVTAAECGSAAPDPGTLSAAPSNPAVGASTVLSADVSDADNSGSCGLDQALSYRWRLVALPRGSEASLNNPTAAEPTFTPDAPGEYAFELVVTDSTGRSSRATLQVDARECGSQSPVARLREIAPDTTGAGRDVQGEAVEPGETVQVTAEPSSDPDNTSPQCSAGQTLSYDWHFEALPSGSSATLNDDELLNPSFETDVVGTYVLKLRVTDSTGRTSNMATFTIEATPLSDANFTAGFSGEVLAAGGALQSPRGLTVDGNGNTYLVNENGNSVLVVDSNGNISTFAAGIRDPQDITYSPSSDELYVSHGQDRITSLTLSGNRNLCTGDAGDRIRGIQYYDGADGGPSLIVTDAGGERTRTLDLNCNQNFEHFFEGALDEAAWIAAREFGGTDHMATTDVGSGHVWKNRDGVYTDNGGTTNRLTDNELDGPGDLEYTPCSDSDLVVADPSADRIWVYDVCAGGQCNRDLLVSNIGEPTGLHFVDDTTLRVTDRDNDTVYDINGDFCSLDP